MARIAGLEFNDNWKVDYALTRIKGIGWSRAKEILESTKIPVAKRVGALEQEEIAKVSAELEKFTTEGDLIREIRSNIQRLRDISSYRGVRHTRGLPVRGQRTKSNARTKRGKRKTIGAFKKEMLTKMDSGKKEATK